MIFPFHGSFRYEEITSCKKVFECSLYEDDETNIHEVNCTLILLPEPKISVSRFTIEAPSAQKKFKNDYPSVHLPLVGYLIKISLGDHLGLMSAWFPEAFRRQMACETTLHLRLVNDRRLFEKADQWSSVISVKSSGDLAMCNASVFVVRLAPIILDRSKALRWIVAWGERTADQEREDHGIHSSLIGMQVHTMGNNPERTWHTCSSNIPRVSRFVKGISALNTLVSVLCKGFIKCAWGGVCSWYSSN